MKTLNIVLRACFTHRRLIGTLTGAALVLLGYKEEGAFISALEL